MSQISAISPSDIERPTLDLSGEALRAATQTMVAGSEEHGGIERYVDAVKLKSAMFQQALDDIDNLGNRRVRSVGGPGAGWPFERGSAIQVEVDQRSRQAGQRLLIALGDPDVGQLG